VVARDREERQSLYLVVVPNVSTLQSRFSRPHLPCHSLADEQCLCTRTIGLQHSTAQRWKATPSQHRTVRIMRCRRRGSSREGRRAALPGTSSGALSLFDSAYSRLPKHDIARETRHMLLSIHLAADLRKGPLSHSFFDINEIMAKYL